MVDCRLNVLTPGFDNIQSFVYNANIAAQMLNIIRESVLLACKFFEMCEENFDIQDEK